MPFPIYNIIYLFSFYKIAYRLYEIALFGYEMKNIPLILPKQMTG